MSADTQPASPGRWTIEESHRAQAERSNGLSGSPDPASGFVERVVCPGCRAAETRVLRHCDYLSSTISEYLQGFYADQGGIELEYLKGARYILRECSKCGLVFQQMAPVGELAQRLYEHWIDPERTFERYERGRSVETFLPAIREIVDVIHQLGGQPLRLRFLDFGAGWGHWARMAAGFGCEVWGSDISPSRKAFVERAGIRTVDLDGLASQRFHYINVEQVFEHLPAPLDTLLVLCKALLPGGLLMASVPDGTDIRRRVRRWDWSAAKGSRWSLNAVAPLEHLNCFSHSALVSMGRAAGLEPTRVAERFYAGARPGGLRAAAMAARRAVRPAYRRLTGRLGTRIFFRRSEEGEE